MAEKLAVEVNCSDGNRWGGRSGVIFKAKDYIIFKVKKYIF